MHFLNGLADPTVPGLMLFAQNIVFCLFEYIQRTVNIWNPMMLWIFHLLLQFVNGINFFINRRFNRVSWYPVQGIPDTVVSLLSIRLICPEME